ncbi:MULTISPECIES: hypothetical protein [Pectobacterium]|uniref:Uncharacterized protein n=1 Tax=Pectobacterium zantedeschiae TaxID=2034769 RepID=A0A9X8P3C4_9GAMM|nr:MULTISPECIES: hypothetical protein [Pectobacterium]MBA5238361.1 hypothetical protein [Pectobacterium aroidearum]RYC38917.1 hypothetical protein CLR69_21945 [Pectobacterium zantedeschiae]
MTEDNIQDKISESIHSITLFLRRYKSHYINNDLLDGIKKISIEMLKKLRKINKLISLIGISSNLRRSEYLNYKLDEVIDLKKSAFMLLENYSYPEAQGTYNELVRVNNELQDVVTSLQEEHDEVTNKRDELLTRYGSTLSNLELDVKSSEDLISRFMKTKKTMDLQIDSVMESRDKLQELDDLYREKLASLEFNEEDTKRKIAHLGKANDVISSSRNIIEKYHSEVGVLLDEFEKIKSDSIDVQSRVDTLQTGFSSVKTFFLNKTKDIDDITEKAKNALDKASDVAVGGHFKAQYENAKRLVVLWLLFGGLFLIGAILICLATVFPEVTNTLIDKRLEGGSQTSIIIARLAIAPLFLLGAWFCAYQYNKQKQIIEDYAYKKVLTLSLLSIKSEIEEIGESHVSEFIKGVQKEILKSPLDSLDKKHFKRESKILRLMHNEMANNLIKRVKEHSHQESTLSPVEKDKD